MVEQFIVRNGNKKFLQKRVKRKGKEIHNRSAINGEI
jgi:hypothetical protein